LKVVHLNTYGGDGAVGTAILRLDHSLKSSGVESILISNKQIGWFRASLNIFIERFINKILLKNSNTNFSLQLFGRSVNHLPIQ